MNRHTCLFYVAVLVALATGPVQAADLLWQEPPNAPNLGDANYFNTTTTVTNQTPSGSDIIFIGAGGNTTHSTGTLSVQKLRVGYVNAAAPAYEGVGTVTVNNGASVNMTVGGGSANASLIIGGGAASTANSGVDGTLIIDGANTVVTAQQVVQIGYGDKSTASATLNITNGGRLVVSNGNLNLGDRNGTGSGVPGHLNISGANSSISIADLSAANADLNIGNRAASTYSQSDGAVTLDNAMNVGQNGAQNSNATISGGTLTVSGSGGINVGQNTAQTSSFIMNGGTVTAGSGGIKVGQNTAHGSSFSVSSGALSAGSGGITVGNNTVQNAQFSVTGGTLTTTGTAVTLIGTSSSQNASLIVGGTAVLNLSSNITVGDSTSQNASLTVSGTADINIPGSSSAGNIFIGRGTSNGASFTMTGGTIDLGNLFLMGTGTTPGATNIVGNHSGGTITSTSNFVLADSFGSATYNLSNNGTINSHGLVIVGRRNGTGIMIQTGGTVTADLGVTVGNAQSGATTTYASGEYNVSGGIVNANQTTGTALSIAPLGTSGTFRVIGDDADINVSGNMTVNSASGIVGKLAYQLENGDSLSVIDVTGTATFSAGAILNFDTSLAIPTQSTYNLISALDIIDNGITFNAPAGWGYHIVSSGNGEILQAFLKGDYNSNGVVDAGDYVLWKKGGPLANQVHDPSNVTVEDYDEWRKYFGNSLSGPNSSSGSSSLVSAQVPEPSGVWLCLSAAAMILARWR